MVTDLCHFQFVVFSLLKGKETTNDKIKSQKRCHTLTASNLFSRIFLVSVDLFAISSHVSL